MEVAADPEAAAVAAEREFDDPGLPARRQGDEVRTQRLFKRAEAARSAVARQRLLNEVVLLNQGMALRIAHRYRGRGIEVEDLEQVALLALIKAVRRFEPGRGRAFAAYAAPSIAGDLKKHFRDHGWGVRPPRAIQELVLSVRSTASDLSQTLHHEPTVAEVAEELQVESDDVAQAMIATQNFAPVSLDAPAPGQRGARRRPHRRRDRRLRPGRGDEPAAPGHRRALGPRPDDPAHALHRRLHPVRDRHRRSASARCRSPAG